MYSIFIKMQLTSLHQTRKESYLTQMLKKFAANEYKKA